MIIDEEELQKMLDKAAERGANLALTKLTNQMYQQVGKTVLKRLLEAVGVFAVAIAIYLANSGWFK